jgi:hypothetical protein
MMKTSLWVLLTALTLFGQDVIEISGAVKTPLSLTADDLGKLPRATLQTKSDGIEVNYEGVWLHEVLKKAGAPGGTELRGKALAGHVIAEAKDGYQVVFSLAEFDPIFTESQILLADRANGQPLIGTQNPFRLVFSICSHAEQARGDPAEEVT